MQRNKMINPNKELFKWGPIDGIPIYIDVFVQAFIKCPEYLGESWPDCIGFYNEDKIVFILDYPELRKVGESLFRKYFLDEKSLKKYYGIWLKTAKQLEKFEESAKKDLSRLKEEEFSRQFIEWCKLYIEKFWVYGFIPELSNWGGEELLKREVLKINKENFNEIFEKLGAPEDLSFFQNEELNLLKIKQIKDSRKQKEMLEKHQKKYYWLRNSYGGVKVLGVEYFNEELNKLSAAEAENKLRKIEEYVKKVRENKKKIIEKYRISREIQNIAEKLSYGVWWQDYRKSFIFKANYITTCFVKEISRRKNISFDEIKYYIFPELLDLVEKNKKSDVKERRSSFLEYYHERKNVTYLEGKEADEFIKPYIEVKVSKEVKEIKGLVVSAGKKVKGIVRILTTPKNIDKMQKGEILVAPMTSPDYIIAIKKASAIITDEGGMTCHAAIVSRELNIPCIVATKIATKVLKDGDLVEVDGEKGVVKVLKHEC